jgi:TPR repeat protein
MTCLASRLFDGRGCAPDPVEAVRWLEEARDDDDGFRHHLHALMLFRGEGTAPDPHRARALFARAATDLHLPSLFTSLEEEALRFRPAATRPRDLRERAEELAADPDALPAASALDLGLLFWSGDGSLSADPARAAALFGVAARAGLAGAQRQLARRLLERGLERSGSPRVVTLLEDAAAQGDPIACGDLAAVLERTGSPDNAALLDRIRRLRLCAVEAGGDDQPGASGSCGATGHARKTVDSLRIRR